VLCDILVKVFVRGQGLPRWHELHGEDGDEAAEEDVAREYLDHDGQLAEPVAGRHVAEAEGGEGDHREVEVAERGARAVAQ